MHHSDPQIKHWTVIMIHYQYAQPLMSHVDEQLRSKFLEHRIRSDQLIELFAQRLQALSIALIPLNLLRGQWIILRDYTGMSTRNDAARMIGDRKSVV